MQSNILQDWLLRRGITEDVLALFHITSHEHPSIGECIRIPITDSWSKYRRHPLDERKPKYLYDIGGKVTLYGLDKLTSDTKEVLITEGELDTLVAWSKNVPAVSSTGGALSFQEHWAVDLAPYDVTVCFDNDEAGAEGMVKVLKYIPDAKVCLLPTMPGVKDISDYVSKGGDLVTLLATAKSYPDVSSVEEDMQHRKSLWQSVVFHEKYLDAHRQQQERATQSTSTYEGDDRVLRAKTYPMDQLMKFTHKKACCPWHNEKTPSLAYYPKTNSAYCFGSCGKAYDVIDLYRHIHHCGFKKAVDELNKLV